MLQACRLYDTLRQQHKKMKEMKETIIDFLYTQPDHKYSVGGYSFQLKEKTKHAGWSEKLLTDAVQHAFKISAGEAKTKVDRMKVFRAKQDTVKEELEFKKDAAGGDDDDEHEPEQQQDEEEDETVELPKPSLIRERYPEPSSPSSQASPSKRARVTPPDVQPAAKN